MSAAGRTQRVRAARLLMAAGVVGAALAFGSCSKTEPPKQASVTAPGAVSNKFSVGAPADPDLSVVLSLDKTELTAADRVRLSAEVRARPGWTVDVPVIGQTLGDFTVASRDLRPEGGPIRVLTLGLEPFLAGRKKIPALTFTARTSGSAKPISISTEPLEVNVQSLLDGASKADLAPAKPPIAIGAERWTRDGWITIGLGASALAAFAGVWSWAFVAGRRTRRLIVDASEIARSELSDLAQRLEQAPADSPDALRGLSGELSAALRRFVERRYRLPASAWSLEQLAAATWPESRPLPGEARATLTGLLGRLDAIRFSPTGPERPNLRLLIDQACTWIQAATAAPVEAAA